MKEEKRDNGQDGGEGSIDMAALFKASVKLAEDSKVMLDNAVWENKEVEKLVGISEEEEEAMEWEEREKLYKRLEVMFGRLLNSLDGLKNIVNRYEEIRIKVNKYHGKEVVKELKIEIPDVDRIRRDMGWGGGEGWKG